MQLRPKAFTDIVYNPGWAIAEALVTAWDKEFDGNQEPPARDPWYRFAVVHSQMHRRLAAHSLMHWDPVPLLKFHGHMARWYLKAPRSASLARCMRTVLSHGVATLGLSS
jgi:hypothetical protein